MTATSLQQTTYALLCRCFTPDVYIARCCKDLVQLALALVARFFVYVNDTLAVGEEPSSHSQSFAIPSRESLFASSSLSPQPTTPVSPQPGDGAMPQLVDLVHVSLPRERETQDCLLLQRVLRENFVSHATVVLGEDSAELRILRRALECVLRDKAEPEVASLMQTLLLINLANASTSIANARSVTSSYRMTNKPCGLARRR